MDILEQAEKILEARQPTAPKPQPREEGSMQEMPFAVCHLDGHYCLMHKRCDICRKIRREK